MNPFDDPIETHKWPGIADYAIIDDPIEPERIKGRVFCVTHRLPEFFDIVRKMQIKDESVILLSSQLHGKPCSDYNTREAYVDLWPSAVLTWFARNLQVHRAELYPLPIGLMVGDKIGAMRAEYERQSEKKHTLYANFEINTNHGEREPAHTFALEVKGAKVMSGRGHACDFYQYIRDINESVFVLCPPGSGIDTWRLWETLYLGSIPVVQRSAMTEYYSSLYPMVLLDFWEELRDFENLEATKGMDNWREVLTFTWWKDKICSAG